MIHAYMKRYCLQIEERQLKESTFTIGEIATQVGYQNYTLTPEEKDVLDMMLHSGERVRIQNLQGVTSQTSNNTKNTLLFL